MPRADHMLGAPTSRCTWCAAGVHVFWAITRNGERMPVEVEPDPAGNVELTWSGHPHAKIYATVFRGPPGMFDDWVAHMPHHATCARDAADAPNPKLEAARRDFARLKRQHQPKEHP